MTRADRLRRMLAPRRVVWIGGAGMAPAIDYMRACGFDGQAMAVHPTRDRIAGLACVAAVADLPWVPDLAVLVIPKEAVQATVAALSALGCGGAICITSGFSESDGGADRQAALVRAAGAMPVIGPNCPGVANFLDGAAFMMDHFGHHGPACGAAVISNGGAYLSDLGCADRSQPVACLVGLGNQAMVGIPEVMEVLLDDARITALNVYFEALPDAADLARAAAKAAQQGVPVVAVKGGQTAADTRAAQSHTASLAGDAALASALFQRFGWIEVQTPSEAIETLKMLSYTALPQGIRTGFVTSSGSYAVLGGDRAEALGLQMIPPTAPAAAALADALPPYVGPANPLDISDAHGWPLAEQAPIYRAFATDPHDLFVQVMCYPPEGGWDMSTWDATTAALAQAASGRPVAFVNTLAEALPRAARDRMIAQGMAPLQGLEDGLRAVAHVARYGARRAMLDPDAMLLPPAGADAGAGVTLTEAAAKTQLARAGLDVPRHWVVGPGDALPDPPGPVALKAMVRGLLHKTDVGAVRIGVAATDLPQVRAKMATALDAQGLTPTGYLVEEMIAAPVGELMVGLRRVPRVGVTLTLAIGGVAVELLADSATLILPAPRAAIAAALRGLTLFPLIDGHRGRARADLTCALDQIEALAAHMLANPGIGLLEINPLILTETRAVIADAVLTERA